jgi:hypothetical protein
LILTLKMSVVAVEPLLVAQELIQSLRMPR